MVPGSLACGSMDHWRVVPGSIACGSRITRDTDACTYINKTDYNGIKINEN